MEIKYSKNTLEYSITLNEFEINQLVLDILEVNLPSRISSDIAKFASYIATFNLNNINKGGHDNV